MRFPYATVCMLFAFPESADADITPRRMRSTFERARRLLATVSGRKDYTDAGEKFENVTLLKFMPLKSEGGAFGLTLVNADSGSVVAEADFFLRLRDLHDLRNPHAALTDVDD
jgi:hypothetical protein